MLLDGTLQHHMEGLLSIVDDSGTRAVRLIEDARRLWGRVQRFILMKLGPVEPERESLELACYALQLPLRHARAVAGIRTRQIGLRERAEQAAELLIAAVAGRAPDQLIDRTVRLLRELPHRNPMLDESRLLSDAVNLDDFGITGMILQAMQLGRQHAGLPQLIEAFDKRRQYGYWEARLKDSFHFEVVRDLARQRLSLAQTTADLLAHELEEDRTP